MGVEVLWFHLEDMEAELSWEHSWKWEGGVIGSKEIPRSSAGALHPKVRCSSASFMSVNSVHR